MGAQLMKNKNESKPFICYQAISSRHSEVGVANGASRAEEDFEGAAYNCIMDHCLEYFKWTGF